MNLNRFGSFDLPGGHSPGRAEEKAAQAGQVGGRDGDPVQPDPKLPPKAARPASLPERAPSHKNAAEPSQNLSPADAYIKGMDAGYNAGLIKGAELAISAQNDQLSRIVDVLIEGSSK